MEEKKQRNREIYEFWRQGVRKYGETGDSSFKTSYTKLAKKYRLSRGYIITICKRELLRDKNKQLAKSSK